MIGYNFFLTDGLSVMIDFYQHTWDANLVLWYSDIVSHYNTTEVRSKPSTNKHTKSYKLNTISLTAGSIWLDDFGAELNFVEWSAPKQP